MVFAEKGSVKVNFAQIIEASVEELIDLRIGATEARLDPLYVLYAEVLLHYLRGDQRALSEQLQLLKDKAAQNEISVDLVQVAALRLQIRERNVDLALVRQVANQSGRGPLWRGECHFVAALAFEQLNCFADSREHYGRAARLLEDGGASKKAVKALMNFIAAESKIDPSKKRLSDYHFVYRKAKKAKEFGTAGMALLNLSREYQLLQANGVALKYCQRAIVFLERDRDTRCRHLALAHRCHLLCELGRMKEARNDLDEIEASDFAEIRGAVQVLKKKFFDPETDVSLVQALTPTWKERLETDRSGRKRLSELEEKLIQALSKGPLDKFELVHALYGEKIGFLQAENRLKNLLFQLRKKCPGLLVMEQGRYHLADESVISSIVSVKNTRKSA